MDERQRSPSPPPVRDATPAEARALAHPLRLRILRLCLDRPMTNRELAARLGRDPGTTLYHVRRLVELDFLAPEPMRRAASGHLEQPYRVTGKSWTLRVAAGGSYATSALDAVREELLEGGDEATLKLVRLGVRLAAADLDELRRRIAELGDDFAGRDDPAGVPVGLLLLAHRRAE